MKAFDVFYSSYYGGRGSFVVYARSEKSAWKKANDLLKPLFRDFTVESVVLA